MSLCPTGNCGLGFGLIRPDMASSPRNAAASVPSKLRKLCVQWFGRDVLELGIWLRKLIICEVGGLLTHWILCKLGVEHDVTGRLITYFHIAMASAVMCRLASAAILDLVEYWAIRINRIRATLKGDRGPR